MEKLDLGYNIERSNLKSNMGTNTQDIDLTDTPQKKSMPKLKKLKTQWEEIDEIIIGDEPV